MQLYNITTSHRAGSWARGGVSGIRACGIQRLLIVQRHSAFKTSMLGAREGTRLGIECFSFLTADPHLKIFIHRVGGF